MKKILLVTLLSWGSAWAGTFPLELIEQFDEARVVAFIDKAELENSPVWRPLDQPPPLTVAAALERLAAFVRQRGEDPAKLKVAEIELRQVKGMPNRWHYLVRTATPAGPRFYAVLLNGRVVAAVREPEAVK